MGRITGIPYARSTLNGWIGCAHTGPGCDNCYAEVWDKRFFGGEHWGPGAPRKLTTDGTWNQLKKWNRQAAATGEFWPVFCFSLADVFDNEAPQEWRDRLWAAMRATPALTYLVVTKRIGNAKRMLPSDWGNEGYANVWLIATMVNQQEVDRDLRKLCETPAVVRGISVEPMLDRITLPAAASIDLVIIGGESDQKFPAREFQLELGEDLVDQCDREDIAVFVKQMGDHPTRNRVRVKFTGKGTDMSEWPLKLQRQEFPDGQRFTREAA